MAKILAIGNDAALLYTRALVLQRTGAMVQTANPRSARSLIDARQFDLVVICHSVRHRDADELAQKALAASSDCRILRLASFGPVTPHEGSRDRFDLRNGPHALVSEAQRLLGAVQEPGSDSSDAIARCCNAMHPLTLVQQTPTSSRPRVLSQPRYEDEGSPDGRPSSTVRS